MKPLVVLNCLAVASATLAIFAWYAVLGIFEKQLGRPVIMRHGEEPFTYDTDVMPFVPCCGWIGFVLLANGIYVIVFNPDRVEPFGKKWWIFAAILCALPFAIPVLVMASAFFADPLDPLIIHPAGGRP